MLHRISRIGLVLSFGFLILILTNPSEEDYLDRVSMDYAAIHGGMKLSSDDLLRMGKSHRTNYLFFSTYEYEFGTIVVRYVGFALSTFQVQSLRKESQPQVENEVLV